MQALIISDKEYQTKIFTRLNQRLSKFFAEKGFTVKETKIGRNDLAFCRGCFDCWVKKPGECIINDAMTQINYDFNNSEVVVYLCQVVFGQFSANIKNSLDRWIPNILPFFETRRDGSTMHPARYSSYPKQIIVGYGDELSDEDAKLFIEVTTKHRQNVEVLIDQGDDAEILQVFDHLNLKKVGALL
ncbi:MAG: flavodoxin family protein [Desulfosporosinus sp.]|nr:flavodoxin family protein [Desulfosporosinus sp.]